MSNTLNDWVKNRKVRLEDNPILQGNFAPVDAELELEHLVVEGELPPTLNGTLLRDGPNPVNPGPQQHWFSGAGMLHAIKFENGRAQSYRNRWIRTDEIEAKLGHKAVSALEPAALVQGSGGVNVVAHANRILALGELGYPFEMSTDAETKGQYNFAGKLVGNMTAHPKIDPATGEMMFFGYDLVPPFLRYHRADATGELVQSVEIDVPQSVMMHDFGVTQSRVVFMDFPVVTNLELVADGVELPFEWDESHQARLGVMDRNATTDSVQWINIDPCFVFHPLNSFDDGDRIVMDVVRYEKVFHNEATKPFNKGSTLVRWTIDPASSTVETRVLSNLDQEFPRVSPLVECHPHRYGYVIASGGPHSFKGLLKHDLHTGATLYHDPGADYAAGEPVFVPAPEASFRRAPKAEKESKEEARESSEDNGYILSVMYNASTELSEVHVIDAKRFEAPPIAVVKLGARVPFGFHGNFVPA